MPKRVLLVDDNPIVRETARKMFESAGFVCDEAENGIQSLEQASAVQPDLIILDLAMPVMNGLQVAPLLRQKLPSTPIILFSLHAGSLLEEQAQEAGITCVVSKDQAASTLVSRVKKLLSL